MTKYPTQNHAGPPEDMDGESREYADLQLNSTGTIQRVLLVDDNVDAANTLAMILDAMGTDVCTENHPFSALARADIETFDLFILDIGLPCIDGCELARRIRATPCAESAIFVALTGYGSEEYRRKSAEAGFRRHFTKPMQIDTLAVLLGRPDFLA